MCQKQPYLYSIKGWLGDPLQQQSLRDVVHLQHQLLQAGAVSFLGFGIVFIQANLAKLMLLQ